MEEPRAMLSDIASSWRTMQTMWNLGLVDVKWLGIGFLASATTTWIIWEITLRRLERKNRELRLMLSVQAANAELLRLGSRVQIDVDET